MFVGFSALNLHKMSIRRGIVGLEKPAAVLSALFEPSEKFSVLGCPVIVIPHIERICCSCDERCCRWILNQ